MTIQILIFLAFILGVPAIALWIWFANKRKGLEHPPHKWDA
jgi:hypothetical protein